MNEDILIGLIGDVASAMVNCPDPVTNKRLAAAIADACALVAKEQVGRTQGSMEVEG